MRIGIDASYSLDRNPSGVAVYSTRLIEGLARLAPADELILGYRANRIVRALRRPGVGANCKRRLLEDRFPALFPANVELFHGLNQRLPERPFAQRIATVHDLFVMSGEYSTPEYRTRFTDLARETASRADRIIAVSAFTAGQVRDLLGYPPEQITVVHHGFDAVPEFSAEDLASFRQRIAGPGPIVLHVGAVQARKNVARLVQAFEGLPGSPLLVVAGSAGYAAEPIERRMLESPAASRIVRLGYVDAATRARLYRVADVFAFPSLDEGFGIPVLEAMSAGAPVLTSHCSALPEVAGNAALLVDPASVDAIQEGLGRLLDDGGLRAQYAAAGRERAAEFSWERCARETLAVYHKATARPG